jgi:1-hydroxycarotenoid 3,4-desaturase
VASGRNAIPREGSVPVRGDRVVIVGAGVAGLVAAVALAARGLRVTLLERAAAPGGKMREVEAGGARIDGGPTVFTMRWVLEEAFALAGERLEDHLVLRKAEVLARHAWIEGGRLDLFADPDRSAAAVADFAGPREADGFRRFAAEAARCYRTLDRSFMRAPNPSMAGLVAGRARAGVGDLLATRPFATLWSSLGDHFRDRRLRQLFGRYSTYVGSSPFLCPATLMLIAHVEQEGVWLVEGGMHRVARALAALAGTRGAEIRYGAEVREVAVAGGRAAGVVLASGERIEADAVVLNADAGAVADGLLGGGAAGAAPRVAPAERSLSALTWTMVARTSGFPLSRHTVFFSDAYEAEFDEIFRRRRIPRRPTVYVCAQDRGDDDADAPDGPERLLVLVNAPPTGDRHAFPDAEVQEAADAAFGLMRGCGLEVERRPEATVATTPAGFHRLFPGTGGALYGRASHGWQASFRRPGVRTPIRGLCLAGGSVHPGAGVPMAARSGLMAAQAVAEDLGR